jgi:hypothetical protein
LNETVDNIFKGNIVLRKQIERAVKLTNFWGRSEPIDTETILGNLIKNNGKKNLKKNTKISERL